LSHRSAPRGLLAAGDHLGALRQGVGDARLDLLDAFDPKPGILATSAALLLTIFLQIVTAIIYG
jgi:hypothetical protein